MNKRKKALNPAQRYIKQLVDKLGPDYLKRVELLRWELKLLMDENEYNNFRVSISTGLYIDTISDFLEGRNNISLKTYNAIKQFITRKKSI